MEAFLKSLWHFIVLSSPYLLLGFFVAGLIHEFLKVEKFQKLIQGNGIGAIIKAAIFGVPLPLCSCSVIPTAVTLRKAGASNGATSSFLVATPESGVDSIGATYALMDWPMTIARPIAAFLSAFVAGLFQYFFNGFEIAESDKSKKTSCCSKNKPNDEPFSLKRAARFGFFELVQDLALWMIIGLMLGALIELMVPEQFFETLSPEQGRLLILLVGIPVYICASATTPIAASLVMKGLSPGSALLLLLVGPATNVSNLVVLSRYIGKKGVILNIVAISVVALAMSYVVDWLYLYFQWKIDFRFTQEHEHTSWFSNACAIVMIGLLLKGIYSEYFASYFAGRKEKHCH